MSRAPHHRDFRRRAHAARTLRWLVGASFAVVGLGLVMACLFTPAPLGLVLLLCVAGIPLIIAGAVVCCVTGRFAAAVTNLVRLCLGYSNLAKLAQETRAARYAREPGPRGMA